LAAGPTTVAETAKDPTMVVEVGPTKLQDRVRQRLRRMKPVTAAANATGPATAMPFLAAFRTTALLCSILQPIERR